MKYTRKIAVTTKDPKILTEILREELRRGNNDDISCDAITNPNCPDEVLVELLRKKKNGIVSWYAAEYTNYKEILVEVLKRGNDDTVSRYASENPNCPPEARIKWMQAIGMIVNTLLNMKQ